MLKIDMYPPPHMTHILYSQTRTRYTVIAQGTIALTFVFFALTFFSSLISLEKC